MSYQELWSKYIDSMEDNSLLDRSLTHSSKTRDVEAVANNERLEFLGDAVLKLTITEYLFNRYSNLQEGVLTKYRAKLVSDKMLSMLAKKINLKDRMNLGSTVSKQNIPDSVLGDAVEALIAAVYLEKGIEVSKSFILDLWQEDMQDAIDKALELEYKSRLQELIQDKYKKLPEYKVLASFGPDHKKEFELGVYLNDKLLAKAKAFSKKEASQAAAKIALEDQEKWLN